MNKSLFTSTQMPNKDWWTALWPDPEGVLRAVGMEAGMDVVDLCCGYGYFTAPMCKRVYPGAVYALDLEAELLSQARQACRGNENFHAVQGDASALPTLLPKPVDLVFIANTFHGVPDKAQLSESVYTVLKPGGRFAIVNWHQRPREETIVLGQPRGPKTELRMPPGELREAVEPAGFTLEALVEVGPYHYGMRFTKNSVSHLE